ncbi:MAG TPA: hypothetical protein DCZ20_04935 [Lachnospiraceae bacterium]|nr:hypothetical protein [Lachnospiraceae bacterium]
MSTGTEDRLQRSTRIQGQNRITAYAMAVVPPMPFMLNKDTTSQLRVPLNIDGNGLILRFSNQFGKHDGIIDHAAAAVILPDERNKEPVFQDVTYRGDQRIVIPAGMEIEADPIMADIKPGMEIIVQVYCKEEVQTICGVGYLTRILAQQGKDQAGALSDLKTYDEQWEETFNQAQIQNISYLKAIDVIRESGAAGHVVLSIFGDSITAQNRWVWPLTQRLYSRYPGRISVLNFGIGGNRLLTDAEENRKMFGSAGVKRIRWDGLREYGITHMIFALGGNDIGMGSLDDSGDFLPGAEEYREGCRQIVSEAHDHGIVVYALSIYPGCWFFQDPQAGEKVRKLYRKVQSEEFDGFIDVEDVLRGGECCYKDGYGYGDNCHLRVSGGEAVAEVAECFLKKILS